ncbi:uncharacterized protein [Nicotiana tomentosiformis]|uniref:uncharacterized protein n=1 Tax=Nicotiana tomentosiformis TaxID=4098 RepID=UPI00388C9428
MGWGGGDKGGKGVSRLRVGSWNIGNLTGKSIELAKILQKRKINIACVQETRCVGLKARDTDGFKLWVSGRERDKNGVGILVDRDLTELVIEVRRVNDMLMAIKLVVGGSTLNMISATRIKWVWARKLRGVSGKNLTGGDFNGHIRATSGGYDGVHSGFGFGVRKGGGTSLLDYAKAFDLVIANSCLQKREKHLVTFRSLLSKTQIDYLLLQKCNRSLCMDYKVIPSENIMTQYRLLVMD